MRALSVVGKERGTNKGIARILEAVKDFGMIDQNYMVNFGYTAENSKALVLVEKIQEKYAITNSELYPVGCVVGTHVGPGACVSTYIRQ